MIAKLPCDLQRHLHSRVLQLRKPRTVLTNELKGDIETYSLIGRIKQNYTQVFPKQYALYWMENALINLLTDNHGLNAPLLPNQFHVLFPNATDEEIRTQLLAGHFLHRLWIIAPPSVRHQMYDISYNMLIHHIHR